MSYSFKSPSSQEEAHRVMDYLHRRTKVLMEEYGLINVDPTEGQPTLTQEWVDALDRDVAPEMPKEFPNVHGESYLALKRFCAARNPNKTPSVLEMFLIIDFIPMYYYPSTFARSDFQRAFEASKQRNQLASGEGPFRIPDIMDLYVGLQQEEAEQK